VSPDDDGLTVTIHDRRTVLEMTGGGTHTIPVGPVSLVDDVFEGRDPPATAQLTNALGIVHDHVDDVLIEVPTVAATPSIVFGGHHARALAQVEIGSVDLPDVCRIERAAIDEVFRTIVAEPPAERRHNPGLDDAHLDTIVATCCIVLAIMRRLALHDAVFADTVPHDTVLDDTVL
jgi:exopolyphosphatase / guanosine-5'-triphosphate,3'-diphosphate pyrophosphatase